MRRLFSKLAAWIIYRTFIYFSRHVSYPDFRIIWEQSYQASVEAEWQRMRMLNRGMAGMGGTSSPLSSTSTKSMLVEQAVEAAQTQNEQPLKPTLPKLEPEGGQEGKQPPSQPMSQSQEKLKYKKKGV